MAQELTANPARQQRPLWLPEVGRVLVDPAGDRRRVRERPCRMSSAALTAR